MEDREIIELYWARSEEAISATAEKYSHYLRSVAYHILANHEDAEECENDTYVAAWNAVPPTRPNFLSAFLGKITRNLALDRFAYYKAAKRDKEIAVLFSELEDCLPENMDIDRIVSLSRGNPVEEQYAASELTAMINDFLQAARKESRMIFVRRYWYADSVKEIAAACRLSEGKVKSVLFRMRQELRKYLEERGVQV